MSPLRAIRQSVFSMSQLEMALVTEVTQTTVSRWERGVLEPSRNVLSLIRREATRRGIAWSDAWFFEGPPTRQQCLGGPELRALDSFAAIINAFGGAADFAAAVGLKASHARTMLARNSIPVRHWPRVIRAASRRRIRGVTLTALTALAASTEQVENHKTPPLPGSATPAAKPTRSRRSGLVESTASHGRGATP